MLNCDCIAHHSTGKYLNKQAGCVTCANDSRECQELTTVVVIFHGCHVSCLLFQLSSCIIISHRQFLARWLFAYKFFIRFCFLVDFSTCSIFIMLEALCDGYKLFLSLHSFQKMSNIGRVFCLFAWDRIENCEDINCLILDFYASLLIIFFFFVKCFFFPSLFFLRLLGFAGDFGAWTIFSWQFCDCHFAFRRLKIYSWIFWYARLELNTFILVNSQQPSSLRTFELIIAAFIIQEGDRSPSKDLYKQAYKVPFARVWGWDSYTCRFCARFECWLAFVQEIASLGN